MINLPALLAVLMALAIGITVILSALNKAATAWALLELAKKHRKIIIIVFTVVLFLNYSIPWLSQFEAVQAIIPIRTTPSLEGLSLREAKRILTSNELEYELTGMVPKIDTNEFFKVHKQGIPPGTTVTKGTIVKLDIEKPRLDRRAFRARAKPRQIIYMRRPDVALYIHAFYFDAEGCMWIYLEFLNMTEHKLTKKFRIKPEEIFVLGESYSPKGAGRLGFLDHEIADETKIKDNRLVLEKWTSAKLKVKYSEIQQDDHIFDFYFNFGSELDFGNHAGLDLSNLITTKPRALKKWFLSPTRTSDPRLFQ